MDRLAKLRDFSRKTSIDLKSLVHNAADELARSPLTGRLAFTVIDCESRHRLHVDLSKPGVEEAADTAPLVERPDLMVYVEKDALAEIFRGELSPLAALSQGRLRYGGDETLGLAIYRVLATTQDAVFEPCRQRRRR